MEVDAVVVGAGPNGLAAAVELARSGWRVVVYEAEGTAGGGARTRELTLPGFRHDVCSAIHPLAAGSPYFRSLPLAEHGLSWVHPDLPVAHPVREGVAAAAHRSLDGTARRLGADGDRYRDLLRPFVEGWEELTECTLRPPWWVRLRSVPLMARFGRHALRSAVGLAAATFEDERARALFAGIAAHAYRPLDEPASAAVGMVLSTAAHAVGWPFPRGGAQVLSDALVSLLEELGGTVVTDRPVESLDGLPSCKAVLLDLSPSQVLRVAGDRFPRRYRNRLSAYRHGPAAFKIDWALHEPIPWRTPECRGAGTVHVGGTLEEVAAAEAEVARGRIPERPFVLVAQHSRFDDTRAPEGNHTGWAYCHVPNGCEWDLTDAVEARIERFAPGFRDCVRDRHVLSPAGLERYNPNYVGGDINGGALDPMQLVRRPALRFDPYRTPDERLFLCSASTPPGPGVHGMCGYHAARSAMRRHPGVGTGSP